MKVLRIFLSTCAASTLLFFSCSTDSPPFYQLTTHSEPSDGGTVNLSATQAEQGQSITITAVPNQHWVFSGWGGDHTGSQNPASVVMDRDKSVTAMFQKRDYPLTITIEGEGTVTEEVIQAKTTDYPHGTRIRLTAQPENGWQFIQWSGDTESSEQMIEVTIEGQTNLKATFGRIDYPLTITIEGEGEVEQRVVSSPKTTDYPFETVVELTALAEEGWTFIKWGGDVEGEEETITVTVDGPVALSALFEKVGRDTNTVVVEVTSPTGRIWMDRNLGASRAATSSLDIHAYGDLYQWGRAADGHQGRTSGTTSTLSGSNQPGHGSFILPPNISPWDWRSPQNNTLWQGVNGINNPCPVGYRLPTQAEWEAERQSWSSNNAAGAFASPLRLPLAGYRSGSSGSLFSVGTFSHYWSGTADGTTAWSLGFSSSNSQLNSSYRALGYSVRCLKN